MNYRGRHFCMETWTIALACIFVLGALALGLSMRPVSTPTVSEFVQVSEAPLEAAPITPEITLLGEVQLAPVTEGLEAEMLAVPEVVPEMEISKPVVVSQPEAAAVEDDLRMENPDIAASYGLLWPY